MFEDVRDEQSLMSSRPLTDPDIYKQSNFTDDELIMLENLALGTLYRQQILKEYTTMFLLE